MIFLSLLLLLTGCTFAIDVDDVQCDTHEDCAEVEGLCIDHVCQVPDLK